MINEFNNLNFMENQELFLTKYRITQKLKPKLGKNTQAKCYNFSTTQKFNNFHFNRPKIVQIFYMISLNMG